MHDLLNKHQVIKRVMNVLLLLYMALLVIHVILVYRLFNWAVLLALVLAGIKIVRHNGLLTGKPYRWIKYMLPVAEFACIILLFYNSRTNIENIIFILFTFDLIVYYPAWFAIPYAIIGFIAYMIMWKESQGDILGFIINLLNYIFLIAAIWGAKVLLQQHDTISELNVKILEQSTVMEDMAKLKERSRIAEEVHNTVGHQLTTAIVSLEAVSLLYEKDPKLAHEKLNIARVQLKEGLGCIREVVRAIKAEEVRRENSFKASVEQLVCDVGLQTGIGVRLDFALERELLSLQEHVLLNVVKEGITNALKHGAARSIDISVSEQENQVDLIIDNTGCGCETVVYGFGLDSMKANVEAIGGRMESLCRPDGFTLHIQIPVVKE